MLVQSDYRRTFRKHMLLCLIDLKWILYNGLKLRCRSRCMKHQDFSACRNEWLSRVYCSYPKCWNTLTSYHSCPKTWRTQFCNVLMHLTAARWMANSVDPDQMPHLWHLIWIYTVCSGWSTQVLRERMVCIDLVNHSVSSQERMTFFLPAAFSMKPLECQPQQQHSKFFFSYFSKKLLRLDIPCEF